MKYLYLVFAILTFSMASVYPINITINDGYGTGAGWHSANRENNETEPGTIATQFWDMERFEKNGSVLTMIGGYNFTSPAGYGGFRPGDLFIDTDGMGFYDYAVVIGTAPSSYNVYAIDDDVNTYDVHYAQNIFSNPWRYKSGGTLIASGLSAIYGSYNDGEGKHYTVNLDLSWLNPYLDNGSTVTLHNTMECGNDNLMGQYIHQVPEGGSAPIMLGFGLVMIFSYKKSRQ